MRTQLQQGQKVRTPDGDGYIAQIIGEEITVKFDDGQERSYQESELTDDADAG